MVVCDPRRVEVDQKCCVEVKTLKEKGVVLAETCGEAGYQLIF